MYQLYDIQINKDILASLTYIALESGFVLSDKKQFDNILYKLYNYTKDNFVFENGIQINEELKAKINEFKTIHNTLPNPSLENKEEFFGTVATGDSTGEIFVNDTAEEVEIGTKKYIPYKFRTTATSSYLYYRFSVFRLTDGYERFISVSTSIPANVAYFKIAIENQTTKYVAYVEFYSEDDSLISSVTTNGSTSYKPTDYTTSKINYVYHTKAPIDVYKLTEYDFNITDENLVDVDASSLIVEDTYYANSFLEYSNVKKAIRKYSLLGKKINNEDKDLQFEEVHYLSENELIASERNTSCDFLFVMKNEEDNSYRAVISNYPLYHTDKGGEEGYWGVGTGVNYYFKVYKSDDGYDFEECLSGVTSASKINGNEYSVSSTPFHIIGYKILYSNYPIFYSYRDYTTLLNIAKAIPCSIEEASEYLLSNDDTMLLNEIEPFANNEYSLVLYKNSDVQFPVKRLPLGAQFKMGSHRIEDSVKFPIIWKVLDYPNKMVRKDGLNYPENSVMVQTAFSIDAMQMGINGQIQYTAFDLLPYVRWCNSEAPAGQWWSPVIENEKEPNEINCSPNGAFSHRAGFLYNWLKEEKDLLISTTRDDYTNQRILNTLGNESPNALSNIYRPKLFASFGSAATWVDNHYFTKHISNHLNYKNNEIVELDDYVCSLKVGSSYWRRQREANNSQKYGSSAGASTDYAYNIRPISPMCCIDENSLLRLEPDANGIYSLDLDVEELIETKIDYECERAICNNVEVINNTELSILNSFENIFETFKATGVSSENLFGLFRDIRANVNTKYLLAKYNVANFVKVFETSRKHNFVHNLSFNTKRSVVANFEKIYATERNTNEEFNASVEYETERRRLNSFAERFRTSLTILGGFTKSYKLHRFVRSEVEVNYETLLETIEHREFIYPLNRYITQNKTVSSPTKIKVLNNFERVFETNKETYAQDEYVYDVVRNIEANLGYANENLVRFVRGRAESIYPTFRYMAEPSILRYECARHVNERHILKYAISRQTIKNLQALEIYPTYRYLKANCNVDYLALRKTLANVFDEANILRYVVQNIDFIGNCERYILENVTDDYETCREIIKDFEKINDAVIYVLNNAEEVYESELSFVNLFDIENSTLREVIENMEVNYPTKRATTVTVNKYVSKDNLMLYTVLLKQEIAHFITLTIEDEFNKRGL